MAETIEISTHSHQAFHDITPQVQAAVRRTGVTEGVCFLFCPHTTAGVTLNEAWDSAVQHDLGMGLDALSPPREGYRHSEGNSPAHLKSALVGASQCVPIVDGRLALGTWQGIYLVEFDGPRQRRVLVQVIAS